MDPDFEIDRDANGIYSCPSCKFTNIRKNNITAHFERMHTNKERSRIIPDSEGRFICKLHVPVLHIENASDLRCHYYFFHSYQPSDQIKAIGFTQE